MRVGYYVIHLSRATDRAENVELLARNFSESAQVVDAVDGSKLTEEQRVSYQKWLYKPYYPFKLNTAEIAVFLSHRKVWKQLVADGVDAGLIVEDDILLDKTVFSTAMALACENVRQGDFVRFPLRDKEKNKARISATEEATLSEPVDVGLGMVLQLVTREAALRLLEATETFDRPVDTFMQMKWIHGTRILSIWPSGATEISANIGGSTIHKKLSAGNRLHREIMRPIYRYRIKRQSRKMTT